MLQYVHLTVTKHLGNINITNVIIHYFRLYILGESKSQCSKLTGAHVKMPTIKEDESKKDESARKRFDFNQSKYRSPPSSSQKK